MAAQAFRDLTAPELVALAITQEEEDGRIYGEFAVRVRADYPKTAEALERMRDEEWGHRDRLLAAFRARYGDHVPLIRRQDVSGYYSRKPLWLAKVLTVSQIRAEVEAMEDNARRFYAAAIAKTSDVEVLRVLGELEVEEAKHYDLAETMERQQQESGVRAEEDEAERRRFVLRYVQPGLAGLMDGSVSTLAPVFAAAFATHSTRDAFLVGMAASLGAGISMGFAEALSDDGVLSGRGHPWARGAVCGLMTTAGGIGHTLPFLIPSFHVAMVAAIAIVAVELGLISWIRHRYMDTPFLSAAFQVVVGGVLVFITGILIGSA